MGVLLPQLLHGALFGDVLHVLQPLSIRLAQRELPEGVQAGAAVLRLFHRQSALRRQARQLEVGAHLQRQQRDAAGVAAAIGSAQVRIML